MLIKKHLEFIQQNPQAIKSLDKNDLIGLCHELRNAINELTTDKPAHLQSSMGVIELTVALHHLLDLPHDVLIWDVGHQTAAHKLLSSRWNAMKKGIRQWQGISGFPTREESAYDAFTTGHSATSLSTLAGMAHHTSQKNHVAVIGDGALTGGMAMEALNFIGGAQIPCLIVLNDNGKSIDENIGALHVKKNYHLLFNAFNIDYIEGGNGHDLEKLLLLFKPLLPIKKPIAIRIETEYAKGFIMREKALMPKPHSFQKHLEPVLERALQNDPNLILVSPAMVAGAGWSGLRSKFPDRIIDVGIAEQNAVAYAAGLARAGKTVVCHLYSTFAQRAIDQIIHDVALQKLPMLLLIDRAGFVGEDGPTHHGLFDVGLLRSIPDLEIWAPAHGAHAAKLLHEYLNTTKNLVAMRIPRDVFLEDVGEIEAVADYDLLIINFGSLYFEAKSALKLLQTDSIRFQFVVQNKFIVDQKLLDLCAHAKNIVIIEDSPGELGYYSLLSQALINKKNPAQLHSISPAKQFHPHGSLPVLRQHLGLNAEKIAQKIRNLL